MTFEEELVGLRPRLMAFAMKLAKTIEGAEDLLQDTMMRALLKREQFTPGTNLSAWTSVIMRNQFYTQARRDGRIVEDPDGAHASTMAIDPPQEPRQELRDTWAAFLSLPQHMQDALYHVGVLGHDYAGAAALLGLPEGTIKSKVSRARAKLSLSTHRTEEAYL